MTDVFGTKEFNKMMREFTTLPKPRGFKKFYEAITYSPPPKNYGKNEDKRGREYLWEEEVESLIEAVRKRTIHPDRNEAIILLMFRHALCVWDLIHMKWSDVDLKYALFHIKRKKGSIDSVHSLSMREVRLLKLLKEKDTKNEHVFLSKIGKPFTGYMIHAIITKAGKNAKLPLSVHPHMLRHSCGFYLAKRGLDTKAIQLYMGHREIANTAIYTQVDPHSFLGLWDD